jgi:hypothetical protein
LVKISRISMISRRMANLKERVKIDTQRLREDALNGLEELFKIARKMAQSKKMEIVQRQMWARVAAYIAQVINSVASSFDERQIDKDLDELERLIDEAKAKAKAGRTEKRDASARKGNPS